MKTKNTAVIKRVLTYSKQYAKYIVAAFFCTVISVTLTLLAPVLVGRAIDNIIEEGNVLFEQIFYILCVLVCAIAGGALFQWLSGLCTNKVSYYTVRDMRRDVFDKLGDVPLSYIDSHSHGDLISRIINDVDAVGEGLLQMINQLFSGIVTILSTIVFMVAVDYKIALVVVLVTPLSLFVASFIGRLSSKKFRQQQTLQGELGGFVEELVGNQKTVKAFSFEKRSQQEFERLNQELYTVGQKAQFAGSLANPSTRFVNGIVYASVGIIGAFSAVNGGLSIGQISCFLTYANQYTKPFNEVTGVLTQLQTALASAVRVFDVLDEKNQAPDSENAIVMDTCKGNLKIENVSFSYKPEQKLIKNFSLNVKSGQRIAIVGPTGCGKTTFINLLMRFYEVNSGNIYIDGVSISDITRNSLRGLYGMVLQESWLFNGTVKENLRYGKPDATDKEIENAAKSAYAHSFIRKMPNGYDSIITQDGANLSQGQRQLMCIARAMVTNPPMLILDEATSSIDSLTEIRVQKAFAKMMQGKTSFVVAHRLSTIKEADVILVMKDGDIIEQGSHNELLQKGGFYSELYSSQFAH